MSSYAAWVNVYLRRASRLGHRVQPSGRTTSVRWFDVWDNKNEKYHQWPDSDIAVRHTTDSCYGKLASAA